jgi:hypothetical protein
MKVISTREVVKEIKMENKWLVQVILLPVKAHCFREKHFGKNKTKLLTQQGKTTLKGLGGH